MLARYTNSFVRSVSSASTTPAIVERRRSTGNAKAITTAEMAMIRENKKRVTSTNDAGGSSGGGGGVRLSALLSRHLGLSRRQAERMVLTERVTLFGKVVTLPSLEVRHGSADDYTNNTHAIKVDGKLITGIDNTIQSIQKEELSRRGVVSPELMTTTTTTATNAGEKAITATSAIRNAGVESEQPNIRIWLANKLSGELVTEDDPVGRPSLLERLSRGGVGKSFNTKSKQSQSQPIHLKPVGRLDMMTEGLIIITNDGRYARELELPSNLFHRTYRARVHGRLTEGKLRAMRNGVTVRVGDDAPTSTTTNVTSLKGGKSGSGGSRKSGIDKLGGEVVQTGRLMRYKGIKVAIERKNLNSSSRGRGDSGGRGTNTWLRITCTEGKNRQLRRILESMGLDVTRLIRISYGDYDLNTIPPGMAIEVPYKQLDEMKKKGPMFGKRRMEKKKTESGTDECASSSKVEWINYS